MYPILFHWGPITLYTYGFCCALGFLLAGWVAQWLVQHRPQEGMTSQQVADASVLCLMAGFFGGRILYSITRWESLMQDPLFFFRVWEGGFVFLGGFLLTIPVLMFYVRRQKIPFWVAADALVVALVLNHAFGRVGCFFAGCCYGKPAPTGWGVIFPPEHLEFYLRGVPLHPTQLYEAGALFLLFCFLFFQHWRWRKWPGFVAMSYCVGYSFIRFGIEFWRGDRIRGFLFSGLLSTSQFLSILLCLGGLACFVWKRKQLQESHESFSR